MKPLLAHDATAKALFFSSAAALALLEVSIRRRAGRRGRSSMEWTFAFIAAVLGLSFAGGIYACHRSLAPLPGSPWWPVIVGLALMGIGIAFRLWAVVTLGRFFQLTVVVQEDHRVVEEGPYRWLRHPSYLGAIVALGGIGLAEGGWVSLALMLAGPLLAFLVRIRSEEQVLMGQLGERYASYAGRTARLIPGLY